VTSRLDLVSAIEGFYVALILDHLHRRGILRTIGRGAGTAALAKSCGVSENLLAGLLEFASLRSGIVRGKGRGKDRQFILSGKDHSFSTHLLDQYVGAFGPCLLNLRQILDAPETGEYFVDRARHADAFADGGLAPQLVGLLEALGFDRVLDIGCGGGQLLMTLASEQRDFRGIGIDTNRNMVATARRRAAALDLADRLQFRHGRAEQLGRALTKVARDQIQGICAVSVANAYFGSQTRIDDFFTALKTALPGRTLVLSDYYSRLGASLPASADLRRTLIHDIAQLVSSQGLPPRDLKAWRSIYARNSVKLMHAQQANNEGVNWFIHVLRL
jgi:SAM-dependent methyltransferase